MKRFLDTSTLSIYQSGKYKGKFDWMSNIGKELYFEYDDLFGYIKILDYKKTTPQGKITLQYKNNILYTSTPNLLHLKIPSLFNMEKQSSKYIYDIGEIISKYNDKIKILSQIKITYYNVSHRGYLVKCLDCGYEYKTREDKISTCPVCGERTSYSERYFYSILKQANVNFIPQKEFSWLPNRWYDVYLPEYNIVIEIHGEQHYSPTKMNPKETPEEIYTRNLEVDQIKQLAALKNGLLFYVIDARNKNNIYPKAVHICDFIDFRLVRKSECERFANYKKIYKECDLWNQGFSIDDICKKLNESKTVVQSKLRIGNNCNMCYYSKQLNMSNHQVINPNNTK